VDEKDTRRNETVEMRVGMPDSVEDVREKESGREQAERLMMSALNN